jgi:hypothetical protein
MRILVKLVCSISVHLGCNSDLLSQTSFNYNLKLHFLILKGSAQFGKLYENTVPEVKHYDQILLPYMEVTTVVFPN